MRIKDNFKVLFKAMCKSYMIFMPIAVMLICIVIKIVDVCVSTSGSFGAMFEFIFMWTIFIYTIISIDTVLKLGLANCVSRKSLFPMIFVAMIIIIAYTIVIICLANFVMGKIIVNQQFDSLISQLHPDLSAGREFWQTIKMLLPMYVAFSGLAVLMRTFFIRANKLAIIIAIVCVGGGCITFGFYSKSIINFLAKLLGGAFPTTANKLLLWGLAIGVVLYAISYAIYVTIPLSKKISK